VNSLVSIEGTSDLTVGVLHSFQDVKELESKWMKLESQLPRVPFLTFDWFVTWWEHWHVQRPMIRDNLFVITFSSARGVLVGVAPLILTCRPGFGLAATRELMSFGIDPSLTELRPVVVPDCYRTQVYGALFEYLNDHPRSWDWLTLTSVPKGVGIERLLASYSGRVKWLKEVPNYVIELPKTFEELKAPLPRNIKESIRKCYNSLRRAGLDFELRVLECVEELQGGLETFYALHRARAGLVMRLPTSVQEASCRISAKGSCVAGDFAYSS
jgi:hypothetical protein